MSYPLRTLDTGITFRAQIAGVVTEIEEREAARFNGYNWREWQGVPRDDRIDGVAHYRLARQIDMVREDVRGREIYRQSKRRTTSAATTTAARHSPKPSTRKAR